MSEPSPISACGGPIDTPCDFAGAKRMPHQAASDAQRYAPQQYDSNRLVDARTDLEVIGSAVDLPVSFNVQF